MEYRIIIEDLPDDRDLLIPVSVALSCDGAAEITCFEEFAETVGEYSERFSGDLLSREALEFLFTRIDPVMKARGYAMTDDEFNVDFVGTLDSQPSPGGVVVLNAIDAMAYENLTEIDLAEAAGLHQEALVCAADGKIVSVAVENFCEDGYVEIACETAESYRRKGCAYSACAALCRDIISDGYKVRWECSESNEGSVALARKLGFKETGRSAYMCYFREEDEE